MKILYTLIILFITALFFFIALAPCFLTVEEQAHWYQFAIVEHGYIFSTLLFLLSGIIIIVAFIQDSRNRKK